MTYKRYSLLAAALRLSLPGVAGAARFGWLDETPAKDSLGQLRTPPSLFDRDTRLTFGIDAYKSLAQNPSPDDEARDTGYPSDATTLKFYGELSARSGDAVVPGQLHPRASEPPSILTPANRLSGFGIKLRHQVDASNSVAVAAGYSETPWNAQTSTNMDVLDTRAALSWTSVGSGAFRPGMTGSVFVGDESARDDTYQRLGRRYYGFSVGGELQVSPDHTPYFSYRVRRNFYSSDHPSTE